MSGNPQAARSRTRSFVRRIETNLVPRKRSSSAGLHIDREEVDPLLRPVDVNGEACLSEPWDVSSPTVGDEDVHEDQGRAENCVRSRRGPSTIYAQELPRS